MIDSDKFRLIILGSSNAIPDEEHENTHMVLLGNNRSVLIDCVSNPILRLRRAGVDFNTLTDLILTHFHPDHVSGVPLLLMDMWLLGRHRPLNIYGLHHTLDRIEKLMGFYDWETWPNFFPVAFYRLPNENMTQLMDLPELRIFTSPVNHLIPTIGLRIEMPQREKTLAYSCDTAPCPAVVELAAGADVLIHEAAGPSPWHTTAAQAGSIAREAEVGKLYLIHYPTGGADPKPLVEQASETFGGEVNLAEDFLGIEF